MTIEIGNKQLKELTAENLRQIIMIIHCCPSMQYWNEPEIIEFDNNLFSDTLVVDFRSFRIEDNIESLTFVFFFNFKSLSYHYHRKDEDLQKLANNGRNIDMEVLRYLIKEGFDVPIY
ncbi:MULTISPECIES: hypothetical protein [Sphingobacterium]|uniref:hypothetical protein n=1 Tax=Sphingobacterium TaxID=28453 RepID=UPI00257B4BDE|nr:MULTISPECIES: hypothetical protein [Sphingobacterium]